LPLFHHEKTPIAYTEHPKIVEIVKHVPVIQKVEVIKPVEVIKYVQVPGKRIEKNRQIKLQILTYSYS
jgi:hypothetical protein